MKVNELYEHWLPPILGADAVTIGNTIYYRMEKNKVSKRLRSHEMVHIEQFKALGIIGFFMVYFGEYFSYRMKGMDHWDAYYQISLEKEAYAKEKN